MRESKGKGAVVHWSGRAHRRARPAFLAVSCAAVLAGCNTLSPDVPVTPPPNAPATHVLTQGLNCLLPRQICFQYADQTGLMSVAAANKVHIGENRAGEILSQQEFLEIHRIGRAQRGFAGP